MKKIRLIAFIILISVFIFVGCAKVDIQQRANAFNEGIREEPLTVNGDLSEIRAEGKRWVNTWIDKVYEGFGVSEVEIEHVSGAMFDQFTDGDKFSISPILYEVSFKSEKPIEGSGNLDNGKNTIDVLVVTVGSFSYRTLSGIIGPSEFNRDDCVEEVYEMVLSDSRYAADLKPKPEFILPPEIIKINMNKVTGGYRSASNYVMNDKIIATLTQEWLEGNEIPILGIAFFDLKTQENLGHNSLGNHILNSIDVVDDKLIVGVQENYDSEIEFLSINVMGDITTYEQKLNRLYSPDKSKFAYTDNGNLKVGYEDGTSKTLIRSGEWQSYYPFAWADNTRLVYGIYGYESCDGCGIVDVVTSKDHYFKNAGYESYPMALINGYLYTSIGGYEPVFDPGFVNLNSGEYEYQKIFKDTDFIKSMQEFSLAISPDGKEIAVLQSSYDVYGESNLYVCSTEDGSIINHYKFIAPFSRPQNLHYSDNNQIIIFSSRYAMSAEYMYVVSR